MGHKVSLNHPASKVWSKPNPNGSNASLDTLVKRCKMFGLCGAVLTRKGLVCNNVEDHDDNHTVRELNAHGDPTGRVKYQWAKLVAL